MDSPPASPRSPLPTEVRTFVARFDGLVDALGFRRDARDLLARRAALRPAPPALEALRAACDAEFPAPAPGFGRVYRLLFDALAPGAAPPDFDAELARTLARPLRDLAADAARPADPAAGARLALWLWHYLTESRIAVDFGTAFGVGDFPFRIPSAMVFEGVALALWDAIAAADPAPVLGPLSAAAWGLCRADSTYPSAWSPLYRTPRAPSAGAELDRGSRAELARLAAAR